MMAQAFSRHSQLSRSVNSMRRYLEKRHSYIVTTSWEGRFDAISCLAFDFVFYRGRLLEFLRSQLVASAQGSGLPVLIWGMWMAISFAVPQTGPLDFARDFPGSGHVYVDVRSASWAGRSWLLWLSPVKQCRRMHF